MAEITTYQCPACTGPLKYSAETGKLECEYCGNVYTPEEIHKEFCGVSQKKILENLAIIDSLGVDVVLRCPIIPDLNENEDHIKGIAEIAGKFNCVVEVQLEPYHRLGISKSQQLGVATEYEGQAPDKDAMNSYCEIIAQISGKKTTIS